MRVNTVKYEVTSTEEGQVLVVVPPGARVTVIVESSMGANILHDDGVCVCAYRETEGYTHDVFEEEVTRTVTTRTVVTETTQTVTERVVRRGRKPILSDDQVRDIRSRVALGEPQIRLASEYGVSQPTVSQIITGKIYTDVK